MLASTIFTFVLLYAQKYQKALGDLNAKSYTSGYRILRFCLRELILQFVLYSQPKDNYYSNQ